MCDFINPRSSICITNFANPDPDIWNKNAQSYLMKTEGIQRIQQILCHSRGRLHSWPQWWRGWSHWTWRWWCSSTTMFWASVYWTEELQRIWRILLKLSKYLILCNLPSNKKACKIYCCQNCCLKIFIFEVFFLFLLHPDLYLLRIQSMRSTNAKCKCLTLKKSFNATRKCKIEKC